MYLAWLILSSTLVSCREIGTNWYHFRKVQKRLLYYAVLFVRFLHNSRFLSSVRRKTAYLNFKNAVKKQEYHLVPELLFCWPADINSSEIQIMFSFYYFESCWTEASSILDILKLVCVFYIPHTLSFEPMLCRYKLFTIYASTITIQFAHMVPSVFYTIINFRIPQSAPLIVVQSGSSCCPYFPRILTNAYSGKLWTIKWLHSLNLTKLEKTSKPTIFFPSH